MILVLLSVCYEISTWKLVYIFIRCHNILRSDDGLVLNRRRESMWSNADPIHLLIYTSAGLNVYEPGLSVIICIISIYDWYENVIIWSVDCHSLLTFVVVMFIYCCDVGGWLYIHIHIKLQLLECRVIARDIMVQFKWGYRSHKSREETYDSTTLQSSHPTIWAITMTTFERHVISNHRPFDCLFNSRCGPTSTKQQSPYYWPFVRGIHRWSVNSPHKGPCSPAEKKTLRCRHNELDGVSDHQPHDCFLNRLFGRRSKKTSKLRITGLCVGNSPGTGEFSAQMASNAENVSIWWRHHELPCEDVIT